MDNSLQFYVLPDLDKKIDEAIHDAINFFDKKCPYCSESLYSGHIRNKIHIDHFIPIAKGGQNVPWNLLPVCQKCNSKKNSKKPIQFLSKETFDKCQDYLKTIQKRYVGEIQINLEKYTQVRAILLEIPKNNSSKVKHSEIINSLFQIVFDIKPNHKNMLDNTYVSTYELENVIQRYFKTPKQNDKIMKLSISEIHDFISKELNKKVLRIQISKKLREFGFISKLERLPEKPKRCYTFALYEGITWLN